MSENLEIMKIRTIDEKKKAEPFLRSLWRNCFEDPKSYEDFYFRNVFLNNIVYLIHNKGMLHLNPYLCSIEGKDLLLHYIVGVATDKEERRKGIMKSLLESALLHLNRSKEPFTYLMPANECYYKPFDFVPITQKEEIVFEEEENSSFYLKSGDSNVNKKIDRKEIRFLSYGECLSKFSTEKMEQLFSYIDQQLTNTYSVYIKHNRIYFDLLQEEKKCQDGDVIFCFYNGIHLNCFLGFFAYAMEKKELCVEQYVMERNFIRDCVLQFNQSDKAIVYRFPYMIRITHVERFLTLFSERFEQYVEKHKNLCIMDSIISENSGIYVFEKVEGQMKVRKEVIEGNVSDVKMTVEELADYTFSYNTKEKKSVFFAEIV